MARIAATPVLEAWYGGVLLDNETTAQRHRHRRGVTAQGRSASSPIPPIVPLGPWRRAAASHRGLAARSSSMRPSRRRAGLPRRRRGAACRLPELPLSGAARPARALPPGRRRLQGGGRRLGRHAVRRGADGLGQRRGAPSAVQGGDALGARGPCRQPALTAPRRTGGARPAAAAGGERHPAGLRRWADRAAHLCPPAARRQGQAAARDHDAAGTSAAMPRPAARCWPAPMPASADAVVLSAYLGKSAAFDEAIGHSPWPMPNRPNRTMPPSQQAIKAGRLPDAAQDS